MPTPTEFNGDIVPGQKPTATFFGWAKTIFLVAFAAQQSGTTANRPLKDLWVGRPYFDTSLGAKGKPIWVDKTGAAWVDATGTNV